MKNYTVMGYETFADIEARNDESAIKKGVRICKAQNDELVEVSAEIIFEDGTVSEEERLVYKRER